MQRVNYYMAVPQLTKLQKLSKQTGLSVAELIRRAVDVYLQQCKKDKSIKQKRYYKNEKV